MNKILTELYTSSPDGLCGNEDCGQMSAWYVFSAMGFYPVNPVEGKYQLGTPLFEKVTIKTGPEKRFVITANKESEKHIYVKKVLLNGKLLDRSWITHEEIMNGGTLGICARYTNSGFPVIFYNLPSHSHSKTPFTS